jgi:hypothetical protein
MFHGKPDGGCKRVTSGLVNDSGDIMRRGDAVASGFAEAGRRDEHY